MHRKSALALLFWLPLASSVACSSSSSSTPGGTQIGGNDASFPPGDGGMSTESGADGGGAGPDAGADGGACVKPSNWPAVVPTISAASTAPAQTGGTLVSGRYYLTAMTIYNGDSSCEETLSVMITLDASAGTMTELSQATVGKSTAGGCVSGTFQTNGDAIVRTTHGTATNDEYSATSSSFTLVDGIDADAGSGGCEPTSMTFTLQP